MADDQPPPIRQVAARPCIFEHVYFSRPDSVMGGHSVYEVRKQIGWNWPRKPGRRPIW
jgi:glutamine phosphoribosylpyrophosphate amidotransferase